MGMMRREFRSFTDPLELTSSLNVLHRGSRSTRSNVSMLFGRGEHPTTRTTHDRTRDSAPGVEVIYVGRIDLELVHL
jgi:hypothetical protein